MKKLKNEEKINKVKIFRYRLFGNEDGLSKEIFRVQDESSVFVATVEWQLVEAMLR